MRRLLALLSLAVAAGCAPRTPAFPAPIPAVRGEPRVPFALRLLDVQAGTGEPAAPRRCLYAHYTGWLTDGTKFDSSRDPAADGTPRAPIAFAQGARAVIAGWDAGFEGMRVGGRRRLIIPYQLAYGELGRPPVIPPRATLVFDVELVGVADTLPRPAQEGPPRTRADLLPRCRPWAEVQGSAGR